MDTTILFQMKRKKVEVEFRGEQRRCVFVQDSLLHWDCWKPSACYFSSVALLSLRWPYLFDYCIGLTDWWGQQRSLINKSALLHLSSSLPASPNTPGVVMPVTYEAAAASLGL